MARWLVCWKVFTQHRERRYKNPMVYTVRYASDRREVWTWYWRSWRSDLWRLHLALFAGAGLSSLLVLASRGPVSPVDFPIALAIGLACVAWIPLYPMVMIKPQVRTLEVGDGGLSTTIGKRTGKRAWSEIKAVRDRDGYIEIVGRNKNAFIVPPRAFESIADRDQLLSFAQRACAAAQGPGARS